MTQYNKISSAINDAIKELERGLKLNYTMQVGGVCDIILSKQGGAIHRAHLKPEESLTLAMPVWMSGCYIGELLLTYTNDPKKGLVKDKWRLEENGEFFAMPTNKLTKQKGLSWLKRVYTRS